MTIEAGSDGAAPSEIFMTMLHVEQRPAASPPDDLRQGPDEHWPFYAEDEIQAVAATAMAVAMDGLIMFPPSPA